ncbi:MAG: hypothetical protein K0S32_4498 [Bacteroidetes bacterium]|jgi:hypothetical protein|nr:hypothetical protein [Bacteroidota bacterium]
MKKLILAFNIIYVFCANAQYTITSSSNPVVGDIEKTVSTQTTNLVMATTGANKLWNYGNLTPDLGGISTRTYISAASIPSVSSFPGANIGYKNAGDYYTVLKYNATERTEIGSVIPSNSNKTVYGNPITHLTLPYKYGSGSSDTYSASSNGVTENGSLWTIGAGTGTLVLPGYTLTNVLLVESNITGVITTTSGNFNYGGKIHSFYSAATKFELFSVSSFTLDGDAFMDGKINAIYVPAAGIGTYAKNDFAFTVFPNPAKDQVTVSFNDYLKEEKELVVYNLLGEQVKHSEVRCWETQTTLNLENLKPGIYYIEVKSSSSKGTKKIIVE